MDGKTISGTERRHRAIILFGKFVAPEEVNSQQSTVRRPSRRHRLRGAAALAATSIVACRRAARPTQDAPDRAMEPLRSPVRPVVRQGLHEGVGREERQRRHRGPHRGHRSPGARGRGSLGREGARSLPFPVSAGGLRTKCPGPRGRRAGNRAAARRDGSARAPVHVQSEDGQVLRAVGFLRPGPRQLPDRPVDRGGLPQRARHLGRPAARRGEDPEEVRASGRHRLLAGDGLQHGAAGAPVVLRRRGAGRAGTAGARLEGDDRGLEVRPRPPQGDGDRGGLHVGPGLEQPRDDLRTLLVRPERDLRDSIRRERQPGDGGEDRPDARSRAARSGGSPRST